MNKVNLLISVLTLILWLLLLVTDVTIIKPFLGACLGWTAAQLFLKSLES